MVMGGQPRRSSRRSAPAWSLRAIFLEIVKFHPTALTSFRVFPRVSRLERLLDDDLDSAEFVAGLAGVWIEGGLGQLIYLSVVHRHE
jgi:hypothetical protein